MSPALNGGSEILCFERSDAMEICNGTMLDFSPGPPHISPTAAFAVAHTHTIPLSVLLLRAVMDWVASGSGSPSPGLSGLPSEFLFIDNFLPQA